MLAFKIVKYSHAVTIGYNVIPSKEFDRKTSNDDLKGLKHTNCLLKTDEVLYAVIKSKLHTCKRYVYK